MMDWDRRHTIVKKGNVEELGELEKDLAEAFRQDQQTWTKFYVVMKEIEDKELFKPEHRSFTAWLKSFCLTNKIPESVVWNRKKAGKTYERFLELQIQRGRKASTLADISEISVSMDSLVLIDKIAKKAPEIEVELVEKALNKELTRADLRSAYKKIRDGRDDGADTDNDNDNDNGSNKGEISVSENKSDEAAKEENISIQSKPINSEEEIKDKVKAIEIVQKIKDTNDWLDSIHERRELDPNKFKKRVTFDPKYKCFDEFPMYTGTTSLSRRVDVLVAENTAVSEHFELNLHGIEIKVDKSDLSHDMKYTEYGEFVHYLWIAIPKQLRGTAVKLVPKHVGILVHTTKNMLVVRPATRLDPVNVDDTMRTIILKSL